MATPIPNLNLSGLLTMLGLAPLLNQNFSAIATSLGERVVGQRISVNGYSATGSTTTKMTVGILSPPGSTPWAVILVRARETNDQAKDLTVTTRTNYSQDGTTLYVYEPAGLVANTKYDLGFLVIFDG